MPKASLERRVRDEIESHRRQRDAHVALARQLDRAIAMLERLLDDEEPAPVGPATMNSTREGIRQRGEALQRILLDRRGEPMRFTDILDKMQSVYGPKFTKNHLATVLKDKTQFKRVKKGYALAGTSE